MSTFRHVLEGSYHYCVFIEINLATGRKLCLRTCIVTNYVRSTTEGNVFTRFCNSVLESGGRSRSLAT